MRNILRVPVLVIAAAALSYGVAGQRNNPFSSNPDAGAKKAAAPTASGSPPVDVQATIAQRTRKIAADAVTRSLKPTELYKVAAGDVLFVTIANASNASGYYTVRHDGTIDFPLAGESPHVEGMTLDEIEADLARKITIFPDVILNVKVREYGSHKINVTGLVSRKGERSLQREALPLFVIKADAGVDQAATTVVIRRGDLDRPETYALAEAMTDDVLVYPGNTVEFASDLKPAAVATIGFFYIAGLINTAGQRELTHGMTLMQAVLASGGATQGAKKIVLRRKSEKGTLNVAEYDLRRIRDGKAPDPILEPGDLIEVTN